MTTITDPDATGVQLNFARLCLLLLLLFASETMVAQEMLGIVNSSYSGITGSVINPAIPVTSPYYLNVNLLAGDVFFDNNYLYLAKDEYQFSRFFKKNPEFPVHGDKMIAYDYYGDKYNQRDKNAYFQLRTLGPSFSVTSGRHSIGFVSATRSAVSIRNVPSDIAKFVYEKLEFPPLYNTELTHTDDIYSAGMAWAEFGLNYSYVIHQQSADYWAAGITVKYLKGYSGGYVYGNQEDYMVNDSMVMINNFTGQAGYSLPLDYETNEYISNPLFRGSGMGIDLGLIYEKKKNDDSDMDRKGKLCAQEYTPYKFKIGLSVLDIGRIRFTRNAEKLVFDGVPDNWVPTTGFKINSVRDITDTLSQMFYGNHTDLIQGHEISIALPTAISIQADVNIKNYWYLNATVVSPMQFSKTGLRRPMVIGLTPRYQTDKFEVSMPVSLYDWRSPRIGLSARYLGFFLGTEKVSGFFHYRDFTGLDLYGGVILYLRKGHCRNRKQVNCGIEEYKMFNK